MSKFRGFMMNIDRHLKPLEPSVKTAILDDGADLDSVRGMKVRGRSFRADKKEWFVGPRGHGTEMARCIKTMCPMAELYIARLDDSRKAENQKFTIRSCVKIQLTDSN
jgi:hypothetical protein